MAELRRTRAVVVGGTLAACGFVLNPDMATAQHQPTLRALLIAYRCEIVNRLERISVTGDTTSSRNRYLAVTVPEHRHGYVQCMFYDNQRRMLCEAASGFHATKPGARRTVHLPLSSIMALERLGFFTDDRAGNFSQEFDVGTPPDFNSIATMILRALHDGYGARAESAL